MSRDAKSRHHHGMWHQRAPEFPFPLMADDEGLYRKRGKGLQPKRQGTQRDIVLLVVPNANGPWPRPPPDPADLKTRLKNEEIAKEEQNHQTQTTMGATTTAFSGPSPPHLKEPLLQFEIGGKNGALNGLHQVKFTDNDDQRILLIDDVFYNTSENRYGVWYHYEGDMDEDGNANTDWVNVYDLFTWATPVKQAPQTESHGKKRCILPKPQY